MSAVLSEWLDNDELFRREAAEGHRWENWYADRLRGFGVQVEQPVQRIREHASQRDEWRDEIDMVANGVPLEVKSRAIPLGRYAGEPMNVCSERAWRAKGTKVAAWVVISRREDSTPRVMVCSGRTVSAYGIHTTSTDRVRGLSSYSVVRLPWDRWVNEETLLHWLRARGAQ